MKKQHKQPTKTGKAMSSISTAKMHKPSPKIMEGLEGQYRGSAKRRDKRLEGKSL